MTNSYKNLKYKFLIGNCLLNKTIKQIKYFVIINVIAIISSCLTIVPTVYSIVK